jgi:NIMA-interacting peptidyl-prolyl cis-trans isomerase 1
MAEMSPEPPRYGRRTLSSFVKGGELESTPMSTVTKPKLTIEKPKNREDPFKPPSWATIPRATAEYWLEEYKDGQLLNRVALNDVLHRKKVFVLGRNADLVDHLLLHDSISRQHAALVLYNNDETGAQEMYVVDLQSAHGTFVLEQDPTSSQSLTSTAQISALPHFTPVLLTSTDAVATPPLLRFGASTRHFAVKLDVIRDSASAVSKQHFNESLQPSQAKEQPTQRDTHKRPLETATSSETFPSKRSKKNADHSDQIHCYHLLIKHKDSRNPSSWKQVHISRSQQEALTIAQQLRKSILQEWNETKSNKDDVELLVQIFSRVAQTESDCNSAHRGGDLGFFSKGKMQPQFESAAFALEVGELSEPVFSDSGVHLILRLA